MKLITREQLARVYQLGKEAGRIEEQALDNLNQPKPFCNTGCRASKCLRAKRSVGK